MKCSPFLGLLIFLSCANKRECTLEITFTSKNNDTINALKDVYFTRINSIDYAITKTQSFHDVKCVVSNKFLLQPLDTAVYIVLVQLQKNEGSFNISYDSVAIKSGNNKLTKELNLVTVRL